MSNESEQHKKRNSRWINPVERVEPPTSGIEALSLLHAVGARLLVIDAAQAVALWRGTNYAAVRKAVRMLYGNVEILDMDDFRVPPDLRGVEPDFIAREVDFCAEQWQ